MGSCVICGGAVDGLICESHEEDVCFEFRGRGPEDLTPGRYYRGTVDGYADFGVFVDVGDRVTGLLHHSELDQRLDSLAWEPGDSVYVQVTGVRDNGNVDLGWSIRQAPEEFRDQLVDTPDGEAFPDDADQEDKTEGETEESADDRDGRSDVDDGAGVDADTEDDAGPGADGGAVAADASDGHTDGDADGGETEDIAGATGDAMADGTTEGDSATGATAGGGAAALASPADTTAPEDSEGLERDAGDRATVAAEVATDATAVDATEPALERTTVDALADQSGQVVHLEGEIVGIRQTGGPTIFDLRDETGTVECAAFEAAGVRAYPAVETGDAVSIQGEVERHMGELQLEVATLEVLAGDAAEAVRERRASAVADAARPDAFEALAGPEDPLVELEVPIIEAATAIRRAVLAGRPVLLRHRANADGYLAGAALERAIVPLLAAEYDRADAAQHHVNRHPIDGPRYDVDAATDDLTAMLETRERHDRPLPLVVLLGAGSGADSVPGYELLSVYDVETIVIDAGPAGDGVGAAVSTLVAPDVEEGGEGVTSAAIAATVAAHVNPDVREDVAVIPAASAREAPPAAYAELADRVGADRETLKRRREAVALEAHYQTHNGKRELVSDLVFGEADDLIEHVSAQYRERVASEVETALANLEVTDRAGVRLGTLRVEEYTHKYDFPPTELLLEALLEEVGADHDGPAAVLGLDEDALFCAATDPVDVSTLAAEIRDRVPEGGVGTVGGRDGHVEFLLGEREAVGAAASEILPELLAE